VSSLKKRKIIFDMDGVITSEERYWDAAVLTVWELLFSEKYLGIRPLRGVPAFKTDPSPQEIAAIRQIIFSKDKVISFFKQHAINSNWDIAFLTFAFHFTALIRHFASRGIIFTTGSKGEEIVGAEGVTTKKLSLIRTFFGASAGDGWEPSFAAVLGDWSEGARGGELIKRLFELFPPPYAPIFVSGSIQNSPLWPGIREIFQGWYWGEKIIEGPPGQGTETSGKSGLFFREEPIIELTGVKATLDELVRLGWELGIATGRPLEELHYPLEKMGIRSYFEDDSVVTHDHVVEAEKALTEDFPRIFLGKPHPFPFLKAYWGKEKSDKLLATSPLLPPPGACWVVGDTMADLLAARDAGAQFIGVLTGPGGMANKEMFTREGAAAVLPDMTHLPDFFKGYHP
jgi:phosphoglycolate phosphatase-like HAD superfamily hydrolase